MPDAATRSRLSSAVLTGAVVAILTLPFAVGVTKGTGAAALALGVAFGVGAALVAYVVALVGGRRGDDAGAD
jgi:hypothetical protein